MTLLLAVLVLTPLFAGLWIWARYIEPNKLVVTRTHTTGAASASLLLIADLHAKRATDRVVIDRIAERCEVLARDGFRPAAVVLAGDLVERDVDAAAVARNLVAALRRVWEGVPICVVLGNHDREGVTDPKLLDVLLLAVGVRRTVKTRHNDAQAVIDAFADAGCTVLEDAGIVLAGGLPLVGLSYQRTPGQSALGRSLIQGYASGVAVFTHSPDQFAGLDSNHAAFGLCGHTHGGQVLLPGFGALITSTTLRLAKVSGWTPIDGLPVFITRGVSQGIPLRFRAAPELAIIHVQGPTPGADAI